MSKKVKIKDLLTYSYVENLNYNPSGTVLAYQLARPNEEKNTYRRDVYAIVNEEVKQLTATLDATIVTWLDDHRLVLARRTEETKPLSTDLFVLDMRGGEALPFMHLPFGLQKLVKVEEDTFVALGSIDATNPDAYKLSDEERKKLADEKSEEEKHYHVVDEVPYWFNGAGFINHQRTALFRVTTNPFKVMRLTALYFDVNEMVVDGSVVYYTGDVRKRRESLFNKVYSYDLKSRHKETIYGKNGMSFHNLFVRDGKLYGQASDMKEYGVNETGKVVRIEKDKLEVLFKPEVSLYESLAVDTILGGGKQSKVVNDTWFTTATLRHKPTLRLYDAAFKATDIDTGALNVIFFDASEKEVAFVGLDESHLSEIYVMNHDGSDLRRLTHHNDAALEDKYIALPQQVAYKSHDEDLLGWVLLPKDYNPKKKYPAVLDIHGGPRATYGTAFFHEMQVWASEGYFVFFTNIRGSDGRGDAFADIRGQYGYIDFDNLMDFTDAVIAKYPAIDTKRICETGGSYGGFMTNWIIGHTDRFVATASQRSISNWISMSFISDIGLYFGPDQCGADGLWDNEKLWEHSPLKYAQNVKTPTLFIHSDEDYRCPLAEGMQMMQALAYRDIETKMVIFHGENHELSRSGKPKHRIRRLNEITDWFNQHTK